MIVYLHSHAQKLVSIAYNYTHFKLSLISTEYTSFATTTICMAYIYAYHVLGNIYADLIGVKE